MGNITFSGMLLRHAEDGAQLRAQQLGLGEREPDAAATEERVVLRAPGAGTAAACRRRRRACARSPDGRRGRGRSRAAPRPARPRPAASRDPGTGTRCAGGRRPRRPGPRRRAPPRGCRRWRRPRRDGRRAGPPGSAARASRARRASAAALRRASCAATASSPGSTSMMPASPSRISGVPSAMPRSASPTPTTAGMPSARARIAACAVAPPRAVAIPHASPGSSPTASPGVSSSAQTMPGPCGADPDLRAGEPREHPPADVLDVDRALAQVRIVERPEGRGRLPRRRPPCAPGAGPLVDLAQRGAGEGDVVEEQRVGGEDLGLGRAAAPQHRGARRFELRRAPRRGPRPAARAPPRASLAARRRPGAPSACSHRAGPIAMPAEAATPCSRAPEAGATPPAGAAGAGARSSPVAAGSSAASPKFSAASARSASSASAAWSPRACTTISSPWRALRTASPVRLRPSAGPVERVALRTSTRASKSETAATKRAAGRAWSPSRGSTRRRSSSASRVVRDGGRASGFDLRRLLAQLRRLHPQRSARLARHLVERCPAARPCRRSHGALHERRAAQDDRTAVRVDHLHGHLGAHQRAAQVHEDQHAVGRADPLHGQPHPLGVRADRAVLDAARRLDRHVLAAHLTGELHDAVGERRAVGDDDETDHGGAQARPDARCSTSTGCTVRTPVACSICQRHVSESHTARSGAASAIWANSPAPTCIAMSYFSRLSP